MDTPNLLPLPRKLSLQSGYATSKRTSRKASATPLPPEGYRLVITPRGTTVEATSEAGFFYARQTLRQLDAQFPDARPCLTIEDWPVYPVRGFYHDVTRGKVPTLKTLCELADQCAHYKINHLQLYIEHTYAFKKHPEVWQGADPLTADEIRKLDDYCAARHIDLVPSFSTFGHFYTWIHHKFPELNELERDVSSDGECWWDRMAHYTLDCRNPKSIRLVGEIIREVKPLFRSRYFNICADETFDLGKGRNQAEAERVGVGRLYVDFLKAIMGHVQKAGAIPMFWGDVIGSHPEFLNEIPEDAVALDWDYSPKLSHSKARLMRESRRPFYVCPGIAGWNKWLPDYATSAKNIIRFARLGQQEGAVGLLNTDWGDFGHIHTLGSSLPGMVLGACASWSPGDHDYSAVQPILSRLVWGDRSGRLLSLLEKAVSARRASWQIVAFAHEPRSLSMPSNWFDEKSGMPDGLTASVPAKHRRALEHIRKVEKQAKPLIRALPCRLLAEEISVGLLGLIAMEEYYLVCRAKALGTSCRVVKPAVAARHLRQLAKRLEAVWLRRNKRAELDRILVVLEAAARQCLPTA